MNESPEGAKIEGGTFKKGIELNAYFPTITIKDGLFDGEVSAAEGYSGTLSISGGYFVNKPSLPVGSDTRFTTVSDQSYRTFQVPVNGDWSESGYNKLMFQRITCAAQHHYRKDSYQTTLLPCRR